MIVRYTVFESDEFFSMLLEGLVVDCISDGLVRMVK